MKYLSGLLLILLIIRIPLLMWGQEKPILKVKFEIKEQNYRDFFASEIESIEIKVNERLIQMLGKYFGFVEFMGDSSDYELHVSLENKESPTLSFSQLREVGFRTSLIGPDLPSIMESVYWMFRPLELYHLPLGTEDGFIEEVCTSMEKHLNEKRNQFVSDILSKVTVADDAYLYYYNNKPYWLIPIQSESSRVDRESEFEIATEIEIPIGIEQKEYKTRMVGPTKKNIENVPRRYCDGKILSIAFAPLEELPNMQSGSRIKVVIIKYVPSPEISIKETSPEELVEGKKEER